MNVYVDGMFFRLSGIGRIYENVLRALVDSPEVTRICTLVPQARREDFKRSFASGKIDATFVDFAPLGLSDFTRKGIAIRGFRPAPDLYYFPNFNIPFSIRGRIVSTVCDLIPISEYSDLPLHKRIGFRLLVRRALSVSSRVVCISEYVRGQIADVFGCPPSRLCLIYPWLDDGYIYQGGRPASAGVRPVEGRYLLFVGNRFPHKNVGTMLEALRLLLPEYPDLKAVVAGARMRKRDDVDKALDDPELSGHVVELQNASNDQVRGLYAHASAFVFPTFTEGFGIPPLEALATGTPVVCSDIPVIREVCGDAVRYAPPGDPSAFAREIRAAISAPPESGRSREKGMERIREFSKENSMARYLDLFRKCCET